MIDTSHVDKRVSLRVGDIFYHGLVLAVSDHAVALKPRRGPSVALPLDKIACMTVLPDDLSREGV